MKRTPLLRKSRLARHTKLRARKRIRPVNSKRRAARFAYQYHSEARVLFVKWSPDVYDGRIAPDGNDNAHVGGNEGMGRKGHYTTTVPLHPENHRKYDRHLPPFHLESTRAEVRARAVDVELAWQRHQERAA